MTKEDGTKFSTWQTFFGKGGPGNICRSCKKSKMDKEKRNFAADDIVLIVDDSAPRNSWVMGRIIQTLLDKRGFIRHVLVQSKTSTLIRPL